ncbi:MAG: sensor domain-containing protein, partial [Thermoleophilia bacterium]
MSEVQQPGTQSTAALPQPGGVPSTGGVPSSGGGAVPSPSPAGPHRSPPGRFFGIVVRPQSWLNLLYLGLAFPLGLFYFVFLTVCLSVGISLVIIWVGIFILGLTAACWWAFAAFERSLADGLLGT